MGHFGEHYIWQNGSQLVLNFGDLNAYRMCIKLNWQIFNMVIYTECAKSKTLVVSRHTIREGGHICEIKLPMQKLELRL